MKDKQSTWWVALGNIGAVYFFACLANHAPFALTIIGFLLFVFVSIPVMMKQAFRKIPLEEINVLTPEQEEKIYNSKQTIKMLNCWDKQTLNRKKQMIIEQRQANIAKEKTSTTEETK